MDCHGVPRNNKGRKCYYYMMQNIFNVLIAQTDWAILTLRVVIGVIFVMHGWRKAKSFSSVAKWFASIGLRPGAFWAGLATAAELLGGLCILIGFLVAPAALMLAVVMIVAAITNLRAKKSFFQFLELDLILLASLLLLATLGSGFLAVG